MTSDLAILDFTDDLAPAFQAINAAWIADASISAITTARPIRPTLAASSLRNQSCVNRGVLAESSTDQTHSISRARPLASHV